MQMLLVGSLHGLPAVWQSLDCSLSTVLVGRGGLRILRETATGCEGVGVFWTSAIVNL
jgi:hypothetical protein